MKNILIDTDPGIDDAVALMFAVGSGRLNLKALTTVSGNLTADRCSSNARKVLDLLGVDYVCVARGQQAPLTRPYPRDPFSHGDDGLANLGLPESALVEDPRFAPDVIVDVVNANPGNITILGLGPLTNIALALQRDPKLPSKVNELIIIGGSYGIGESGAQRATGDNPASEWNIYVDPEAAKIVFEAGFRMTAIGLDIATHPKITLSEAHRRRLRQSPRRPAWFLAGVIDFVESRGFGAYCGLIDSLAVAVALDRSIVTTQRLRVGVETRGDLTLGATIVDRREHFQWTHLPQIDVVSDIDADRFFELLLRALT